MLGFDTSGVELSGSAVRQLIYFVSCLFCVVTQFDVNLCIILTCCDGYFTMYFSMCLAYNQAVTLGSQPWLATLGANHRHPVGMYHHFSLSFDM
jgi:hypothetical protein